MEDRINNNESIDCTELFSKSMVKKVATARTSEVHEKKMSSVESDSSIKELGLKNVLAKDFIE